MKREVPGHWKFDALREMLGLTKYETAGVLETLWWWTAEHRDDGRLTGMTAPRLAMAIGWRRDASELVGALVTCGWLDDINGVFIIHDWHEHCPPYVHERRKQRIRRARKSAENGHESQSVPPRSPDSSRLDRTSLDRTGLEERQELPSVALARAPDPEPVAPRKPPRPVFRDGISAPLPSMLSAAQEIRVETLGASARLSDSEERRLRGYASECMQRGAIPAFLEQWRGFHADAYWRGRAPPCPLSAFLKEPSKYGASVVSGFQRPVSKSEGSEVIE